MERQKLITGLITGIFLLSIFSFSGIVQAESKYPKKDIKMIVMWRAGGGADTATRIFTKQLEKIIGQNIVVNNITGGAATVGYLAAKTAKPNGYNLVTIQGDLPKFELMNLAPIAIDDFDILPSFAFQSPVLAVRADAPWNTVEEFVADAQKKTRRNYGRHYRHRWYLSSAAGALGRSGGIQNKTSLSQGLTGTNCSTFRRPCGCQCHLGAA